MCFMFGAGLVLYRLTGAMCPDELLLSSAYASKGWKDSPQPQDSRSLGFRKVNFSST